MLNWKRSLLLVCLFFQSQVYAGVVSTHVSGETFEYDVRSGDSLAKIGARFGIAPKLLAQENNLPINARISPPKKLIIDNRHIVPANRNGNLLINIPQRMLYLFNNDELIAAHPVGLGKPSWATPLGAFSIQNKVVDKAWIVPISIQQEMRQQGKAVITQIPPGPNNPLGKYWLGLSLPGIGIHGTTAPTSIYQFLSHGCIRLRADDIKAVFMKTERGMTGEVIYAPLLLAEFNGRIFLEVNPDVYKQGGISIQALETMAQEAMLTERIDWARAKNILALQDGIARDVTLAAKVE